MQKIGLIGCGFMGKPIAENLLEAGYDLTVYDIRTEATKELEQKGAIVADSVQDMGQKSDIVITMLPSSPQVEQVMYGASGIIENLKKGGIIIDMTTGSPVVSRKIAADAEHKGIEMLDAPVSGGVLRIKDKTLTIMVGGKEEVFEKCKSLLQCIGTNTKYVGNSGMGAVVKLTNQLLVGISLVSISEAFLFGTKLGGDPKMLWDVLVKSSGTSFLLERNVPYPGISPTSPANDNFEPEHKFSTNLMTKDLGLCLSAADATQFPLFLCGIAHQLMKATQAAGLGNKDCSIVSKLIRHIGGEKIQLT